MLAALVDLVSFGLRTWQTISGWNKLLVLHQMLFDWGTGQKTGQKCLDSIWQKHSERGTILL